MAARLTPPVNENDHVKGPLDASIELVEYGDYQCPHCRAAFPVVKAIERNYSKNLKFVYRNFPLAEAHPYAEQAAIAAEAAGQQGRFWQMHDTIYERQAELSPESLFIFAELIGLNMEKFEKDIKNKAIAEKVEADFVSGMRSGVNGTPSFFINSYKYVGSYDFESLAHAIESLIGETQHR
jgi:protein-disulfide isomerase